MSHCRLSPDGNDHNEMQKINHLVLHRIPILGSVSGTKYSNFVTPLINLDAFFQQKKKPFPLLYVCQTNKHSS